MSCQRSMARSAGRDEDGARREHQAGDPGHAIIVNADPRDDKEPVPHPHLPLAACPWSCVGPGGKRVAAAAPG